MVLLPRLNDEYKATVAKEEEEEVLGYTKTKYSAMATSS